KDVSRLITYYSNKHLWNLFLQKSRFFLCFLAKKSCTGWRKKLYSFENEPLHLVKNSIFGFFRFLSHFLPLKRCFFTPEKLEKSKKITAICVKVLKYYLNIFT